MIPKIIHYCWFGGNPIPDEAKKYMESWLKYCPDYEIIEWNESNFDINENNYCREAYEAKKWAFVTDYVRLKVLYEYGGFYMDTDVEVVKPLDPLREYNAVSGYESNKGISTGIIGATAQNEWIKFLLEDYRDRHFLKPEGNFDLTTNVVTITNLTVKKYGLSLKGQMQFFGENMIFLPFDYLCAKDMVSGEIAVTSNTYTIHHFSGSWLSEENRRYNEYLKNYIFKLKKYQLPDAILLLISKIMATHKMSGNIETLKKIFTVILKKFTNN